MSNKIFERDLCPYCGGKVEQVELGKSFTRCSECGLVITNYSHRKLFVFNNKTEKRVHPEEIVDYIYTLQNLKDTVQNISFQGIISAIYDVKKITKSGEDISFLTFRVSDSTDVIRVIVYRERADELAKSLKSGDGVLVKDVELIYNPISRLNEATITINSSIEKIDLKIEIHEAVKIEILLNKVYKYLNRNVHDRDRAARYYRKIVESEEKVIDHVILIATCLFFAVRIDFNGRTNINEISNDFRKFGHKVNPKLILRNGRRYEIHLKTPLFRKIEFTHVLKEVRRKNLLKNKLPKLLKMVELMEFNGHKIDSLKRLLKAVRNTDLITKFASRFDNICDASINALEGMTNIRDKLDIFTELVKIFQSIPQWKIYEDRTKKLVIIAEINTFDWKDEAEIEYMFKQGGSGSLNHQLVDWKIYNVDSGGDSYIYIIANNKPTMTQLKEASEIFENFPEDKPVTQETSFPYSTGYYDDDDEEEEKDDRTKLQEVSGMFSPLDRWFKKEE